jgi:carbon storage regulator
MLVFKRRPDQALMIGDNITVKVMAIRGGQVRIGLEAPRDVTILREELIEKPGNAEPGTDSDR